MNDEQAPSRLLDLGRFVVLRHETPAGYARPSHWDLLLEAQTHDGLPVLRAWSFEGPSPVDTALTPSAPTEWVVEALPDHRLAYLLYEGPVSHNRGDVLRVAEGSYRALLDSPQRVEVELSPLGSPSVLLALTPQSPSHWHCRTSGN